MSADVEKKDFGLLCDRLIQEHPGNAALEDAVIQLEVAHTKHVNALKREFNDELDQLERQARDENERRDRRAGEDMARHESQLALLRANYDSQQTAASENHKRDLARIKIAYESLLEDGKRRTTMVSQIHEDHARELQRVKDEYERVLGNKEKEIARLHNKLEDESLVARQTLAEADEHYRRLEEETATLRNKLLDSDIALEQMRVRHHEELTRQARQEEKVMRSSTRLLSQFQDKSADLELELSQMRAMMFDKEYQDSRLRLRDKAFHSGCSDIQKEMDELDARKEREREALVSLLDRVTKAKEDQEKMLYVYQRDLRSEMESMREAQRLREAAGGNGSSSHSSHGPHGHESHPSTSSSPEQR